MLSPQDEEELFRLFLAAHYHIGSRTTKEYKALQAQFKDKLRDYWNALGRRFPNTFEDFRRTIVDQFLQRLRRNDPRFPGV